MKTKKINKRKNALTLINSHDISAGTNKEVLQDINAVRFGVSAFTPANVVAIEFSINRTACYGMPEERCSIVFEMPPAPEWRQKHIENIAKSAFKRQTPWQLKVTEANYRLHVDLDNKPAAEQVVQLLNAQIITFNKYAETPFAEKIEMRQFHKTVSAIKNLMPDYWTSGGTWSFPSRYRVERAITARSYVYINEHVAEDDKITRKKYAANLLTMEEDTCTEHPEQVYGMLKIYCNPFALCWQEDVEVKVTKHNQYVFQD